MAATVVFDVIGTLFSLERVRPEFTRLGAPELTLELWFAQSLRDFFAYSHAGGYVPMAEVMAAALPRALAMVDVDAAPAEREAVTAAMSELEPGEGAAEACAILSDVGCRVVALTNGSAALAGGLLERSGLDRYFDSVRSCDEIEVSKPAPEVYAMAEPRGDEPVWMVAAHAWDVAGAQRAGLRGAWVSAAEGVHLDAFPEPDVRADDLAGAARALLVA